MCGYVSVCVCVCHMTSGQAGNSNDRAVAAEGGPAGGVWLTLAVTPGFTWGKYARVPLSPTLLHLCLHPSFFWKRAIFTFSCLQHVSYLNQYFRNTLEGWRAGGRGSVNASSGSWVSLQVMGVTFKDLTRHSVCYDVKGERWRRGTLSWACTECSNLWNCKL